LSLINEQEDRAPLPTITEYRCSWGQSSPRTCAENKSSTHNLNTQDLLKLLHIACARTQTQTHTHTHTHTHARMCMRNAVTLFIACSPECGAIYKEGSAAIRGSAIFPHCFQRPQLSTPTALLSAVEMPPCTRKMSKKQRNAL